MSQFPPPLNPQASFVPTGMPPARPSNAPAVASLVLGLLGCVPWLTGVLAIVFGVVGIRKTRTGAGGQGMAVAGLVLGILSVVGWTLFSGSIFALVAGTAPIRDASKQFVRDLAEGKPADAVSLCTADISAADCTNLSDALKPLGALQDVTTVNIAANYENGAKTAKVEGIATFATSPVAYSMLMIKQGDQWKVRGFDYKVTAAK